MSANEHIDSFARGWINGDVTLIQRSLAPGFRLHDPAGDPVPGDYIAQYVEDFKRSVAELRGDGNAPLMAMSDIVVDGGADAATAWAWWSVPGTSLAGSALIKAGAEGIVSEHVAYHAPPGERESRRSAG